jgi:glycosyltransferase involved in cell wall biosynthesis
MSKINVLYDISVLGVGQHDERARTGVFRAVENIACELNASDECNLRYCASNDIHHWYTASDYLRLNNRIHGENLCSSAWVKVGNVLNNHATPSKRTLFRRIVALAHRSTVLKVFNALQKRSGKLIDPNILRDTHIFHAGHHHPFPEQINATKHIKKFIFLHDIIPILFPEFYPEGFSQATDYLISAINGLDSNTWILCNSLSTRNDICNHFPNVEPSRVFVTYLGVSESFYACGDLERIKFIKKKYEVPEEPYLLSVCTLEPRKNIVHLIKCFEKLVQQEEIKDLNLVLVGAKGWLYDDIFACIRNRRKLEKRVIVTGFVDDNDLAPLYGGAMVFIYPSLYEGFGLPVLEAMKCGVPIITSNTSSLPEVVGNAGIMLDPKDEDGLCQSIIKIYSNEKLRTALIQKGIDRAKEFSWDRTTHNIIQAYETAMIS